VRVAENVSDQPTPSAFARSSWESLGFPEEQAFLRDIAERKKASIEAGIGEVIGRDVSVRCIVANIEMAPVGPSDDLVAEARRIFGEDLVDVGEVS
jgi:hypothetical protein